MKKILHSALFLVILSPTILFSQVETVDLNMIYKIKQEGLEKSGVEELAFWMTDYLGPRLAASKASDRANGWTKTKMEELGLQNVRIERSREFSRGGWDNIKTYAAMTAPYYANFTANPVAWTGSTAGLVKSEVILLDIKSESDFDKFKGKLSGKIILLASAARYDVSYTPLATRFTDQELKDLTVPVIPLQPAAAPS